MEDDDLSTNRPSFRDSEVDDEQSTSRQPSSMAHSSTYINYSKKFFQIMNFLSKKFKFRLLTAMIQSPIIIKSPIPENVEETLAPIQVLNYF